MQEYICARCGHTSTDKSNFIRHMKKKKVCPPVYQDISREEVLKNLNSTKELNFACRYCSKGFGCSSSKYRHEKACFIELKMKKEIDELKTRLDIVETQRQNQSSNNTNNINNGNLNQGTINNITINAFGKENIDYLLEHSGYNAFMINCIKDRACGLMNFLLKKHFDPKHPENINIRKLNKKDDFMEINDGKKWRLRFKEDVLEDVFIHLQNNFSDFVEQCMTTADTNPLKKQWLDNFMQDVGEPLNWDLSNDFYEYCENLPEEKKTKLKEKIYKLAIEHVYRSSQTI